MQRQFQTITAEKPVTPAPLRPEELIPDAALRSLAKGGAERQIGMISSEDQVILAMYLEDLCGELLALRAANRKGIFA